MKMENVNAAFELTGLIFEIGMYSVIAYGMYRILNITLVANRVARNATRRTTRNTTRRA